MAGLALDLAFAGLSLGTATAAGAAIGAILSTARSHGRRLLDRFRGFTELRCDDAALRLLIARQVALTRALLHRGHAAQGPVQYGEAGAGMLSPNDGGSRAGKLPPPILAARTHPHWSSMGPRRGRSHADPAREAARHELAALIEAKITHHAPPART
jgi:hypothetical protein